MHDGIIYENGICGKPFIIMIIIEMFYLNTIKKLFLFVEQLDQLEVCLPYSRLLTGVPKLATWLMKVVKSSEETCEVKEVTRQKSVWQTENRILMSIYVYLQVSSQKQVFFYFCKPCVAIFQNLRWNTSLVIYFHRIRYINHVLL